MRAQMFVTALDLWNQITTSSL